MHAARWWLRVLLVVSIVPVLAALPPEAQSQSLTTITNLVTVTTPTSVTTTSTFATTSTETYEYTTTSTSSLAKPKSVLDEKVTIKATTAGHCATEYRRFKAQAGDIASFNLAAQTEFTVYILDENDYTTWARDNYCAPGSVSNFNGAFTVTSYAEDIVLPDAGLYYIVLLNYSQSSSVTIQVNVQITGSAILTGATTTTERAFEQFSTLTLPATTTMIVTSRRTDRVLFGIPFLLFVGAIVAIVVAVAAILAFTLMSKKRSRTRKPPRPAAEEATPATIQVAKKFCISCGAELPEGAKFCNKCGTTQT